ncbi:peptidoglycan editing factor PgeF [Thiomicrospira microaerophila]|uniref:peptidoglycan editing factor PgeF n=1 Tax=Thiomicrospira microaerophila TaxID=406020 RepID=UPI0005CB790B|nr:peptidoglycan editing factor PgeF [Thiomicrospira microaerophila]
MTFPIIKPNWPAEANVQGFTSTRQGGVSSAPYDSLNLAEHVGDNPQDVAQNRALLAAQYPAELNWAWLDQQHTTRAVHFNQAWSEKQVADAMWTDQPNQVCTVMTADCLPILLTNKSATLVAAVHAGWRGLADGIVGATIASLPEKPSNMMAWIGPAISQASFEVGDEVLDAFVERDAQATRFFSPSATTPGQWMADLPGLAKQQLAGLGVEQVFLSGLCTFRDEDKFYSFRRNPQTGRMVSAIWLTL